MSAQRDLLPLDEIQPKTEAVPFALKEQAAQRLAAHRARRTQRPSGSETPSTPQAPTASRTSRIAATVAERYANSQSYRAFLAEQAEAAIRQAEAAAQVAALNAQAVAEAQNQLLAELDQWALTPPTPPAPTLSPRITEAHTPAPATPSAASLTVKLYAEDQVSLAHPEPPFISNRSQPEARPDESEALALEEEIAFRQSPVFEDMGPPIDIPANLIEFPRQLVAPRKARPRLAEGPLREEADHAARQDPHTAQLRIFEVEADQISTAPALESVTPEWSSILLPAQPVSTAVQAAREAPYQPLAAPQTALFSLRLMAGIVDGCIIAAAFLAFVAVFAVTVGRLSGPATAPRITAQTASVTAAVTLIALTFLYQLLFFTFSEATPGMRYARIGLCTLSDDNPTRSAMRRRILAMALAACPLGIGFLWAWFDDDGLGWHDRISRMYQRSY
jgi:uncharacterized RDD family membrane protein YckC